MMAIPFVVDPEEPTLSRWLDHFDHAVSVMGIEHVGLGADFVDQVGSRRDRRAGKSSLGTRRLHRGPTTFRRSCRPSEARGYDGERLEAIESGNWLRVLRATLPA